MRCLPLLLLAACARGPAQEETPPPERDADRPPLELPDVSDVDFEAAFLDALRLARTIDARAAWAGHRASLAHRSPGCPDLWFGEPEELDGRPVGLHWADACNTGDGTGFDGIVHWTSDLLVQQIGGQRTEEASRELTANGVVLQGDDVLFELDGAAEDSLYLLDGGASRWVYNSLVRGTVTGTLAFPDGASTPTGYRADLYLRATGGDVDTLEVRGEAYFFGPRVQERFDSLAVDLSMTGPEGLGPDDCALEPTGWIALRDAQAYWYDLVFLPASSDDSSSEPYPNEPRSVCDGCGTLYVRGVESGEICLDFDFLFDGSSGLPELADYILGLHDLP